MNTYTTALENTKYYIEHLFQVPIRNYKTFGPEDILYFDSIEAKPTDIVSSTFGKYASSKSLLNALLEARAYEKNFDE